MLCVYNSLSKKKEEFKPLHDKNIGMYVCGPTIYDHGHLGHGRSAVSFDVIRRYLEWKGFEVNFVMNFTDIDDKMINRAKEENITVKELADRIGPEYHEDFQALGVKPPTHNPKATEFIPEMIDIISKLEQKGATYVISDGVYYDVSKFPEYGKLSGQKLEELEAGARVELNKEKKTPFDFVLWKFEKPGEPAWESPWGRGRPGWHIECSAMSSKLLGETIDIHGGGLDLMFPHHECEVAQSELANGKPFVRYFLHNGFITINEEKMSKSLGNFVTLKKIFEQFDPAVVRLMYLQTHYRNPINFSDALLSQARSALENLRDFVRKLRVGYETLSEEHSSVSFEALKENFERHMDDDFNTSGGLSVVFELMNQVNGLRTSEKLTKSDVDETENFLKSVDGVLNVLFEKEEVLSEELLTLIQEREEARKEKDFATSDRIRQELLEKGIEVEDTAHGPIWKKR